MLINIYRFFGYTMVYTVHLGYNDVSIPQSRIAISKLSLYPERFTDGTGIIDSKGPNRNKEDIVISRIVITRVDCTIKSLKRFYFTYHNTRKYTDITEAVGWTFCEQPLMTVS